MCPPNYSSFFLIKIKTPHLTMLKENDQIFLDLSLFRDPAQKFFGFILDQDPSSIQVSWKSIR